MHKADIIEASLDKEFDPVHVEVVDESHMHSVGAGAQSHFKVVLVSKAFEGKPLLARHRAVNSVVSMADLGIHALALHTFAPDEWSPNDDTQSPDCHGGSGT